ncbi:CheR family methyltransferase [Asanoa sp. WMMD1127]|uniref:CheR family methyltransferase n=1 Tax=Asanoa sp. WMMD1127 TaxID=3016107 RepID=UPI002415F0E3|nr:CheR family methyltransferase [Asanoa sp. WMMD1127]MDG4825813.1 CheR family methyltransferase [Asanoa sp. WMMD1127]
MTSPDPHFESLLLYLKEQRGFDFTGYKRSSLMRRVGRRMDQVGTSDYVEYLDYLQVHPDEFTALFNTILINVTGFFRDPEAWDYLSDQVLRPLIDALPPTAPFRVWSAGCASGEEAYTLAIVLAELMGVDAFRQRVKIYATDVDEEGLAEARLATYGEREIKGLPERFVSTYFEPVANRYAFRKDLRRSVIFGRNDLVQDAPISRIDLLVCRNTLMYLNAETQARILGRFHFALGDSGVLFLGKAEMLLSHGHMFLPVDLKRRIFKKVPRSNGGNGSLFATINESATRQQLIGLDQLRDQAFVGSPVAQIVVTTEGLVALTNRTADAMLGVSARDIGRPFRDLEISYRPTELRKYIEQAQVERRTVQINDIELEPLTGDRVHLEIQVNPIVGSDSGLLGVSLFFHDVTATRRMQDELRDANRQLETAYEELQSTNEELETTNEELQSTVEELETTNEELQSTNEELETMNEELQSTNDELQSINDQLRDSSIELDSARTFLESVLSSLEAGVIVVSPDLQVQAWNRGAEQLWGLRREEVVGQHLLNLDIGLPIDDVRPALRRALAATDNSQNAREEIRVGAVNRRGRPVTLRLTCAPLLAGGSVSGAIMAMEPIEVAQPG